MINLASVTNINEGDLFNQNFDLLIFACGYESRSIDFFKSFQQLKIQNTLVLHFNERRNACSRNINEKFLSKFEFHKLNLSAVDEKPIYKKLETLFINIADKGKNINILIDYTSMPKIWYTGIFNYIRLTQNSNFNIFLNYTHGEYQSLNLDYQYESYQALPFHEGTLSSNIKSLLVLTLGFSPNLTRSIIQSIEPNKIIGVLPIPGNSDIHTKRSEEIKSNLSNEIDDWVNTPIDDVEKAFNLFTQICQDYIHEYDVIFLPLGPKPFTIATILAGQRFKEITCLHLNALRNKVADVISKKSYVLTKISMK